MQLAERTFCEFDRNERDSFSRANLLSAKKPVSHGVSFNETVKLGAFLYEYTGKAEYLKPVIRGYHKVFKYQMLPDGLHSCNENLSDRDYMQTHECCDVTDFSRAMSILVEATGDGAYADRAERCVYNAGLGAVDKDFKALQYFSGLNQIVANDCSNHTWYMRGSSWNAYRPNHITPCCTGNCNRFFPEIVLHSYLLSEHGIAAIHYGDLSFMGMVDGKRVEIEERSSYPFDEEVRFSIKSETDFEFALRIPAWCENFSVSVAGEKRTVVVKNGFVTLRVPQGNTDIFLTLPSEAKFVRYCGGAYVEKGCILYALACKEARELSSENNGIETEYPKWNLRTNSPWNYAIDLSKPIVTVRKEKSDMPWRKDCEMISLEVSARRLTNWKARLQKKIKTTNVPEQRDIQERQGKFLFTPRFPRVESENLGEEEKILLIPFAATTMRISVFPIVK